MLELAGLAWQNKMYLRTTLQLKANPLPFSPQIKLAISAQWEIPVGSWTSRSGFV